MANLFVYSDHIIYFLSSIVVVSGGGGVVVVGDIMTSIASIFGVMADTVCLLKLRC